jgi:hypothetical protein
VQEAAPHRALASWQLLGSLAAAMAQERLPLLLALVLVLLGLKQQQQRLLQRALALVTLCPGAAVARWSKGAQQPVGRNSSSNSMYLTQPGHCSTPTAVAAMAVGPWGRPVSQLHPTPTAAAQLSRHSSRQSATLKQQQQRLSNMQRRPQGMQWPGN